MNSGHPLFFRASTSCSKLLNVESIFNTAKNSRATLFFRASASCSKILDSKKYIEYSEKFQGKPCFQGKRNLLKILNTKIYSLQWKFSGQLCFFSGQAQVAQKSWTVKKFSIQCRVFLRKMLGTWYEPLGARFPSFQGPDFFILETRWWFLWF